MKKIFLTILFLIISTGAFARTGTVVSSGVTVGDPANTFAAAYCDEIQGCPQSVADITARNAIPAARRVIGMTAYVASEDKTYRLIAGITNSDWVEVVLSGDDWVTVTGIVSLATNSNNVGIGTALPMEKLDVKGSQNISETLSVTGSGTSFIEGRRSAIEFDNSADGVIRFKSGGEAPNTNNESLDLDLESTADKAVWTSMTGVTEQVWNNKLTVESLDIAGGVRSQNPLLAGLISYYRMDNNLETTIVVDSKGVNNGVAPVNVSNYSTLGLVGNAFSFENNHVNLGAFIGKPTTGDFCVEFIMSTTQNGTAERVAGNRKLAEPKVGWEFARLSGGTIWFSLDVGATISAVTSVTAVNTGGWFHVVGCREAGMGEIYINGVREGGLATSMAGDIGTDSGSTYLGGTPLSPNEYVGKLDNVRMYSRALSDLEIQTLYDEVILPPPTEVISDEELNVGGNVVVNGNIFSNYNVGIGTINPQGARLTINGEGVGNGLIMQTYDSVGTPRVTMLDNGNVGVGTVLPTGTLTVQGPTVLSGGLYLGGVQRPPQLDIEDRLIAFYKFEDNAADLVVTDSFGAYPGTSVRNTSLMTTTGKINNGFTLASASSDYINLVGFPNPTTNITVDFWMKTTSNNRGVMGNRSTVGNLNGWLFLLRSDHKIMFYVDAGASVQSFIISTTSVDDGNWHHIIGKRNEGLLELKVDGVLEGTQIGGLSGDMGTDAGETWIGDYPQSSVVFFNGQLDNVRIFNGVTTDDEDDILYSNGVGTEETLAENTYNVIGDGDTTANNFTPGQSDLIIKNNLEIHGNAYIDKTSGHGQVSVDGSSGGCLMLRDSDNLGWTKCIVLDGIFNCVTDANGDCSD